ncbi:ankyrin repeat domain-containing protein [Sulfurimonas sp.]|nr:ankyrin repeat domain-containing protein [Sulfurimonas sp.]
MFDKFAALVSLITVLLLSGCGQARYSQPSPNTYVPPKPIVVDKMLVAIQSKDLSNVKKVIDNGYDVSSASIPLVKEAVKKGTYDILKLLLMEGANPNYGGTSDALSEAIELENLQYVDLLITAGIDVNLAYNGYKGEISYPIISASCDDTRFEITKSLLAAGANPNANQIDGYTALHISYDSLRITELLLSMGANPNLTSSKVYSTPLMFAAMYDKGEVCELLLNAGANVNVRDDRGMTALDYATDAKGKVENYDAYSTITSYGGRALKDESNRRSNIFAKIFATGAIAGIASSSGISAENQASVLSAAVNDIWVEDGKGSQLNNLHKSVQEELKNRPNSPQSQIIRAKVKQNTATSNYKSELNKYQEEKNRVAQANQQNVTQSTQSNATTQNNKLIVQNSVVKKRLSTASGCEESTYTAPSFTEEGKGATPGNELYTKSEKYMKQKCVNRHYRKHGNLKFKCDVLKKGKYGLNLERCTSQPLTFTCGCERKKSKPGIGAIR